MGLLALLKQTRPSAIDPSADPDPSADFWTGPAAELAEEVRDVLVLGFLTRDQVLTEALQWARDVDGLGPETVTALVDQAWQRRLAEQAAWPRTTDAERLEAAFTDLNRSGILARMDFFCCRTCAIGPIGAGRQGYVWFHAGDAERLVRPGAVLRLSFGSSHRADPEADDAPAIAIGERIRSTLRQHRLRADWNGNPRRPIAVDLDWRRRLPI
jgi:hypothetical protein